MSLQARIESAITRTTGETADISNSQIAHGGSINNSRVISLKDGRQFFIKTHAAAVNFPDMFKREFEALKLLASANVIRVPNPLVFDDDYIIMEKFNEGQPRTDWAEVMGRHLALLHRSLQTERFGFDYDNYLGTTLQINRRSDSWLHFWRENRLGYQLGLFSNKTGKDDKLLVLGDRLLMKLDALLGDVGEVAVLLHGDLWSGNASADEKGEPIIFDPASYYGHREAEIGMMRMFGGFGTACEAAYGEIWPFEEDSERRIALYRLYHELNHLNLFGKSYYQSCISTMESLL